MNRWGWLAVAATVLAVAVTGLVFVEPVQADWLAGDNGAIGATLALTVTWGLSVVLGVLVCVPRPSNGIIVGGQVAALIGLLAGAVGCTFAVLNPTSSPPWVLLTAIPALFWVGLVILLIGWLTARRLRIELPEGPPASGS